MKNLSFLVLASTTLALAGCGADSGITPEQDAAFKKGDKSAIKGPPPGGNAAPKDFKSSINDGVKPGSTTSVGP
ncbi:hypothetical protein EON81_29485 [bacterium]|nr:MAG: hypothetical protein EON81_29485 [bacterium]